MSKEVKYTAATSLDINNMLEDRKTTEILKRRENYGTTVLPSASSAPVVPRQIPKLIQRSTNRMPRTSLITNHPEMQQHPSKIAKHVPMQTSKFKSESSRISRPKNLHPADNTKMTTTQIPVRMPANVQKNSTSHSDVNKKYLQIDEETKTKTTLPSNAERFGFSYGVGRGIPMSSSNRCSREIPSGVAKKCINCVKKNKGISQIPRPHSPVNKNVRLSDTQQPSPVKFKVPFLVDNGNSQTRLGEINVSCEETIDRRANNKNERNARKVPQSNVKKCSENFAVKKEKPVSKLVKKITTLKKDISAATLEKGDNTHDDALVSPVPSTGIDVGQQTPAHWQKPPSPKTSFRKNPQVQRNLKNVFVHPSPKKLNLSVLDQNKIAIRRKRPTKKCTRLPTLPTIPGSPPEVSLYLASPNISIDLTPTLTNKLPPRGGRYQVAQPDNTLGTITNKQPDSHIRRGSAGQLGNRGYSMGLSDPVNRNSSGFQIISKTTSGIRSRLAPTYPPEAPRIPHPGSSFRGGSRFK